MAQQKRDPAVQAAVKAAMRELVRVAGPTQKEASKRTGIPQPKMSEVLNGTRIPRVDTLIIMRKFLNRSIDSILGLSPIGVDTLGERMAELQEKVAGVETILRGYGSAEDREKLEVAKKTTRPGTPATDRPSRKKKGSQR